MTAENSDMRGLPLAVVLAIISGFTAGVLFLIEVIGYHQLLACDLGLCIFAYGIALAAAVFGLLTQYAMSLRPSLVEILARAACFLLPVLCLICIVKFVPHANRGQDNLIIYILSLIAVAGTTSAIAFSPIRWAITR